MLATWLINHLMCGISVGLPKGQFSAQQTIRISKRLSACKQIPLKEIVVKNRNLQVRAWGAGKKKSSCKNSNPVEIVTIVRS